MRAFATIIIILLFCSPVLRASDSDAAAKAYEQKNYKEAVRLYEKLVKEGFKSFELYYNLGNAYYRNNELGKAIYYYELARKIEPNDEDVRINLGIANSKTVDRIAAKENFFVSAVKTNVLTAMSTRQWAWTGILLCFALCVAFFIYVASGIVLLRRIMLSLSGLLFISAIVVYFLGNSALNMKYADKFAIILGKEVRVTNEPTSTAHSKFELHEGTKVHVIEKSDDWVLIGLDNGNEGWLKVSDVGII